MFKARLIRRCLRRTQQTLRYGTLNGAPILFANSFPKSGTHLLTQVLAGFSKIGTAVDSGLPAIVTFDGFTGRKRSLEEILGDLLQLLPGDIAYGHIHSLPEVVELLCQPGWAGTFILRDPRDVAVSHVHYISRMAPKHIHHRYYHDVLTSFPERLEASIAGVPVDKLQLVSDQPVLEPLPNLFDRFKPYMGWLDHPEILILRFEDFVNNQYESIAKVFDHAQNRGFKSFVQKEEAIEKISMSINPERSPTFRTGKVGAWRGAFDSDNLMLLQQNMGDLLDRLGYQESTLD